MSLVNDMLNDLDARRDKSSSDKTDVQWLQGQPKKPRKHTYWWLAIGSLLLAVIAVAVITRMYRPDLVLDDVLASAGGEKATITEKVSPPVVLPAEQNRLSGLQIEHRDGKIIMAFMLNQQTRYQIDQQGQQLKIKLMDVSNGLKARDLKPQNPVKSIAVQQTNEAVTLTLGLISQFSYVAQMVSDQQTRLEVSIDSLANAQAIIVDPVVTNTTSTSAVPDSRSKKMEAEVGGRKKDITLASNVTATNGKPGQLGVMPDAIKSGAIKKALPPSPEQRDRQVAQNARKMLRAGNASTAEQSLRVFLQQQPTALHSGEVLASILLSQQRFNDVEVLLSSLRQIYPSELGLLAIEARRLLLTGNAKQSVDMLMSEQPTVKGHTDYYELLALAARQNKQYQLSEQVYRGLLETDNGQGDWWVGMGIALDAQGDIAQAKTVYQQALKTKRTSVVLANYARQRLSDSGS